MAFDTVNEVNVYTCTGQPLRSDIANIVEWMLNEDFSTAYNSILFWLWDTMKSSHRKVIFLIHKSSFKFKEISKYVWANCSLNYCIFQLHKISELLLNFNRLSFAVINDLTPTLRKQKSIWTDSKDHVLWLWLVNFDSFCSFSKDCLLSSYM